MGCYMSKADDKVYVAEGRGKNYAYAVASCQGWRREQEDAEACLPSFDDDASLFILCDGHGGPEVAQYTVENFPQFLKNCPLYKEGKYEEALKQAFVDFDLLLRTDPVMVELKKLAYGGPLHADASKPILPEGWDSQEPQPSCSTGSSNDGTDTVVEDVPLKTLVEEAKVPIRELLDKYSDIARVPNKRQLSLTTASPVVRPKRSEESAQTSTSHQDELKPGPSSSQSDRPGTSKSVDSSRLSTANLLEKVIHGDLEDDDSSDDSDFLALTREGDLDDADDDDDDDDDEEEEDEDDDDDDDDNIDEFDDDDDDDEDEELASTSKRIKQHHGPGGPGKSASSTEGAGTKDYSGPSSSGSQAKQGAKAAKSKVSLYDEDEEDSDEQDDDSDDDENQEETEDDEDIEGEHSDLNDYEDEDEDEDEEDDEEEDDSDEDRDSDFDACTSEALADLFTKTPDTQKHRPGFDSGCTVVCALMKGRKLYVANAGDSRCIVVTKDGRALAMTNDHKPEDEIELDRITKAGGRVVEGRVNGGLNLSRAFGDFAYKNSNLDPRSQMITPFPDIEVLDLQNEGDYILLACDGIWNSISNRETAEFITAQPLEAGLVDICVDLFRKCIAPSTDGDGSGCDNMTCILVEFDDPLKPKRFTYQTNSDLEEKLDVDSNEPKAPTASGSSVSAKNGGVGADCGGDQNSEAGGGSSSSQAKKRSTSDSNKDTLKRRCLRL